jgi:hypothetical protein
VSLTPAASLPPAALTPVPNLPPVSSTPAVTVASVPQVSLIPVACKVDTSGKFAAGVLKPVTNLPTLPLILVVHLDLQRSSRIFEQIPRAHKCYFQFYFKLCGQTVCHFAPLLSTTAG